MRKLLLVLSCMFVVVAGASAATGTPPLLPGGGSGSPIVHGPVPPPSKIGAVTVRTLGYGRAVAGAAVTARSTASTASQAYGCKTDSLGICSMTLPLGTYTISASKCPMSGSIQVTVSSTPIGMLQAMHVIQMITKRGILCPLPR